METIRKPLLERLQSVRRCAAKVWGVTELDIIGRGRIPHIVEARQMVCYRLVKDGYIKSEIGRAMGLNHATVLHAFDKYDSAMSLPGYGELRAKWKVFSVELDRLEGISTYGDMWLTIGNAILNRK